MQPSARPTPATQVTTGSLSCARLRDGAPSEHGASATRTSSIATMLGSCQCASNKTGRAKMINRRRLSHLHLGRLVPSAKASAALLPVSPPSSDASMPLSMPLSRKAFQSAGRLRSSRIAPVVVGASAPDNVAAVPAGTPMCSRSGRNQGAASLSLACSMCRLHVRRNRRSASERRSSTQRREYRPGTVPVQYRYPYM